MVHLIKCLWKIQIKGHRPKKNKKGIMLILKVTGGKSKTITKLIVKNTRLLNMRRIDSEKMQNKIL